VIEQRAVRARAVDVGVQVLFTGFAGPDLLDRQRTLLARQASVAEGGIQTSLTVRGLLVAFPGNSLLNALYS
jgi:hypothetical protein